MIQTLVISNFLSHKASLLNFSEGVNVIVGPTDSGKSAVIKALKWATFNRPMGDGMRSTWGGDTCVSIRVGESVVTRFREDGANGYRIEAPSVSEFNAIKGDVPVEVAAILDLSELNLQTQFDSHFLLSNSAGEVAQVFNRVAHLDRIDSGLQNVQRWSREIQKKLEYNKESLDATKERLLAYDSLDSIEKSLLSLEEKEATRERLYLTLSSLLKTIGSLQRIDDEIEEVAFLEELDVSVCKILATIAAQKGIKKGLTELRNHCIIIKKVDKELKELESDLSEAEEEFHAALGKGSICPLCEQVIK